MTAVTAHARTPAMPGRRSLPALAAVLLGLMGCQTTSEATRPAGADADPLMAAALAAGAVILPASAAASPATPQAEAGPATTAGEPPAASPAQAAAPQVLAQAESSGKTPAPRVIMPSPRPTETKTKAGVVGQRDASSVAEQNRFYDQTNPNFAQIQKANQSMAGFPIRRSGEVDWIALIENGTINPRAERTAQGKMEILDLDIMMKNTQQMPWVRFPHRTHTLWLACKNCHEGIFKATAGANNISMNDIFRGKYCGVCHNKVAFSIFQCERCHSVPQPGAEAWWTQ